MNEYAEIKVFDGALRNKTKAFFEKLPSVIALLSVITTAALLFTDVTVEEMISWHFAGEAVLMMFLFSVMYLSMSENGIRAGKSEEVYRKAKEEFETLLKSLEGREWEFCDFLEWYVGEELRQARKRYLSSFFISYSEWYSYYCVLGREYFLGKKKEASAKTAEAFEALPKYQKKAMRKASLMKPIRLSPEMLIREEGGKESRSGISESMNTLRFKRNVLGFTGIFITAFLVISVAIDVAASPDISTWIYGCLKILSLLFAGFRGFYSGYLLYAHDAVDFHRSRSRLLRLFNEWGEGEKEDKD